MVNICMEIQNIVSEFKKSDRKKFVFVLFYGLFLSLTHMVRMIDNCIWADEALVVIASRQTFSGMLRYVASNGHTPFHYILAWICVRIFRESGLVYHFSATLPYFILIGVSILIVRKWFGNKTALLFITLCSLLDGAIVYNLEIRMYAWCQLFVFLTYLMFYKLYTDNEHRNCYYFLVSVFSVAAVYAHYFALASIGVMYAVLFIYILRINIKQAWKVMLSGIVVPVTLSPWLMYTRSIRGTSIPDYGIPAESWTACFSFIFHFNGSGICSLILFIVFWASAFIAFSYDLDIVRIKRVEGKFDISIKCDHIGINVKKIDIWMLSGIIGVLGTIVTAQIISKVLYPIITLRYLYVSYIILWLVFSICLSKTKFSDVWAPLLVVCLFFPGYKRCIDTIKNEQDNNRRLEDTLQKTSFCIDENDFIYTNSGDFGWTLSQAYYPKTPHSRFGNPKWEGPMEIPVLDHEADYWLFLTQPIPDDINHNLTNQGRKAEMVVDRGYIGLEDMWIYKIVDM